MSDNTPDDDLEHSWLDEHLESHGYQESGGGAGGGEGAGRELLAELNRLYSHGMAKLTKSLRGTLEQMGESQAEQLLARINAGVDRIHGEMQARLQVCCERIAADLDQLQDAQDVQGNRIEALERAAADAARRK